MILGDPGRTYAMTVVTASGSPAASMGPVPWTLALGDCGRAHTRLLPRSQALACPCALCYGSVRLRASSSPFLSLASRSRLEVFDASQRLCACVVSATRTSQGACECSNGCDAAG